MLNKFVPPKLFHKRLINYLKCWQSFSTQLQPEERLETFRTSENNPANHTLEHVGQFYKMPQAVRNQLFFHGGFPKTFETHIKTFAETCLMIRTPSIDIINCLKNIDYSKPVVRFVLYGASGVGKTLSMAHIMHYAYDSGFVIVHVPWVGDWTRRRTEVSNSTVKEGCIDLNLHAAAWLIHFKTQNSHILSNPELRTSQEYVWSKREITPQDAPLLELLEHGVNRIKYASETVIALANEIKVLSKIGKLKTLIAIDGFNAFFYPKTRIFTEKKEMVHPLKITLSEAFVNLTKFDWNNAAVVVTVDEIAIADVDRFSPLPKYLLGKEGFEHMDPFIPIAVSEYTSKELSSCLDYYRERRWIQPTSGQNDELAFLSGRNPYRLLQLCTAL